GAPVVLSIESSQILAADAEVEAGDGVSVGELEVSLVGHDRSPDGSGKAERCGSGGAQAGEGGLGVADGIARDGEGERAVAGTPLRASGPVGDKKAVGGVSEAEGQGGGGELEFAANACSVLLCRRAGNRSAAGDGAGVGGGAERLRNGDQGAASGGGLLYGDDAGAVGLAGIEKYRAADEREPAAIAQRGK